MRMAICAWALGIWLCQRLPALPPLGGLFAAALASLAAFVALRRAAGGPGRLAGVCLVAFALGFVWAGTRAHWRLADELPVAVEGRNVVVTGVVAELPQPLDRGVRFVLRVESATAEVPQRILLSWYVPGRRGAGEDDAGVPPSVHPGERWRLVVRLKRPHGFANPDGFDYEAWLLERGLRATGYVRVDPANVLIDPDVGGPMALVHRARDSIRARFLAAIPHAEYAGVLVALAVGDQNAISDLQWEVFRRTAVSHLVSISGLHVSLVALVVGGAVALAWRRAPRWTLRVPARKAGGVAGLAAATAYALLAGLGIPAQRSLIMLAVVAVAMLLGRESAASRVLALALACVLIVDPWAVLAAGFWLSFGAVAVILYVVGGRIGRVSGWRVAVGTQLGITVATVPALLVLFNAFSLLSPVANALAIPVFSFVITPLALVAIVLPHPSILELAHWLTEWLMRALEALAALPFAMWQQAAPPAVLAASAIAGVAWLMLPRGTPGRHVGVLAALPILGWTPARPGEGEFRMTVLDVGHGVAVHLQTATRDILYDTGPAYGPGADAGTRVILPYFAAGGVTRLDRVVLSHDDLDHTGGARSVLSRMPVGNASGARLPDDLPRRLSCVAGERWRWDGVEFDVLHPQPGALRSQNDNDGSCVLRIATAGGTVLLAGDVERGAERTLLEHAKERLAADVVVVPHHGSRSSSSPAFVAAVDPGVAIFAVGNLNPFRHPHPDVWSRWAASGARNWRTDSQGAIRVEVTAAGVRTAAERLLEPRYWHGR